jgi:hypothetical protein
MAKLKALLIGASATVLISAPVSVAVAQSALSIGDNDSVLSGSQLGAGPGRNRPVARPRGATCRPAD